jgi:hypothetical protein
MVNDSLSLRLKARSINNENEDVMFGENSFCCIFVLSTNYKDIGLIEYANEEVLNLFGYTS